MSLQLSLVLLGVTPWKSNVMQQLFMTFNRLGSIFFGGGVIYRKEMTALIFKNFLSALNTYRFL